MSDENLKEVAKELTDEMWPELFIGFAGSVVGAITGIYMASYRLSATEAQISMGFSIALLAILCVSLYATVRFGLPRVMLLFAGADAVEERLDEQADTEETA